MDFQIQGDTLQCYFDTEITRFIFNVCRLTSYYTVEGCEYWRYSFSQSLNMLTVNNVNSFQQGICDMFLVT